MSSSAKNSSHFLERFSGKIAVINKSGQISTSEPFSAGLPSLSRVSQCDNRSTASTIDLRKKSYQKSWTDSPLMKRNS